MKTIAYLQCPTGIAGDMCLGALVGAGVPLDYLIDRLAQLGIADEYELSASLVRRNGQQATKFEVDLAVTVSPDLPDEHHHEHHHDRHHGHHHGHHHEHSPQASHSARTRHLPEIEEMIRAAGLPPRAESWSLAVFRQLAEAEGAVHGVEPERVHFHEVGATDAIVDIVGTCLGLDWLGIEELYCSPLPTGGGTVWVAHGRLAVPVPAVLKLLESRRVPVYSNGIEKELVTPTGAAIAVTLAKAFGPPPPMAIARVGLGAGSLDLALPNILQLWVGEATETPDGRDLKVEEICVLETQIDDLSPQAIAYTCDRLFDAGAVDVFTQAIGMKKSRAGILLTAICPRDRQTACETVIFRETTTLGIRRSLQVRSILNREFHQVSTKYGEIQIKVATDAAGTVLNVHPEYEDCAQIARDRGLPWQEVHRSALEAWYARGED
ncbi:nickel pincer cofactor biosynthesis protein LarC [Oxynema sp. CENA135]|uniref:nickel pincer cofactor biosynthesis protein LarC n=1 Tax=Oxynema sp. CENA135 TaxID=984206 RepID=UPI00190CE2C4|nr:nickel pincer cofactor biosynthesis protein LarC [Oxynema sp. CENA135]MBK4732674.1 nickel pincer cofactor biosynthesis protein LarC [Oxynema sp. CENA135]